MDIIRKLNELRLERDLSVYRLAELSGINQSTLANTFSRGTIPSIANLELICETLGITMSQFFAEDTEPMPLSILEKKLIEDYRKLQPALQRAMRNLFKDLSSKKRKKQATWLAFLLIQRAWRKR